MTPSNGNASPSRGMLLFGGVLSLLVGVFAVSTPQLFSLVLTQLIGALCLVTGVISLFQALFGKSRPHRFLSSLSAIIRIAAGSALLFLPIAGMAVLTLIVAVIFLTEGVVCLVTSVQMRTNPAWVWLLLNGVVALLLGGMIYEKWPLDSVGILGILYGIQSLFSGSAMLMLGLSAGRSAKA